MCGTGAGALQRDPACKLWETRAELTARLEELCSHKALLMTPLLHALHVSTCVE